MAGFSETGTRRRRMADAARLRRVAAAGVVLTLAGCRLFGGRAVPAGSAMGGPAAPGPRAMLERYARAGLLAAPAPVSFVGSVRTLAGPSPDSTLTLVALSLPTHALSFVREGDRYRASYDVTVEFRQGDRVARRLTARQAVRVGTYTETVREDESVLFQDYALVAPGSYDVAVTVRDSVTGARGVSTVPVQVPRHAAGRLATPIVIHQAMPRARRDRVPELVANPRASLLVGRDTALRLYIEGYGLPAHARIGFVVQDERGRELLRDTASIGRPAAEGATPPASQGGDVTSGVVSLRVKRLEVGLYWLGSWREGTADSLWIPFFILSSDGLVLRDRERGAVARAFANARLMGGARHDRSAREWEKFAERLRRRARVFLDKIPGPA